MHCAKLAKHTKGNYTPTRTTFSSIEAPQILSCDERIPAVCVAVAVNVALTGAARSWTLQHILMHGQN